MDARTRRAYPARMHEAIVSEQPKRPQTPTVKIATTTPQERAAINILTPQERKDALLAAARVKATSVLDSAEVEALTERTAR